MRITQVAAALIIGMSERQVGRLVSAVRKEGDIAVVHKSRGKESSRKIDDKRKDIVLGHYTARYKDFGPTLATEKLKEIDGIEVSKETLRMWLIKGGL